MEPVSVFSEIGKLNAVMVHRPGVEINNLHPKYLKKFLFDDLPNLKIMQREHDVFTDVLKKEGVKVYYVEKLLEETLDGVYLEQKTKFIKHFVKYSVVNRAAYNHVKAEINATTTTAQIVDILIGGCINKRTKVSGPLYYMNPLPNILFQRDPFFSIGHMVNVSYMDHQARYNETTILNFIMHHHPILKNNVDLIFHNIHKGNNINIEGGDILVLNKSTLLVGLTERTTISGVKLFAHKLFSHKKNTFKKIIAITLPLARWCMHLDTVFTKIDINTFLAYEKCFGDDQRIVFHTIETHNHTVFIKTIKEMLLEVTGEEAKVIFCGSQDRNSINAAREQWNDGTNVLAIRPGTVIAYDRNDLTNETLKKEGIKLIEIPSSELSRGRGGPRCMSMPLHRTEV